MPKNNEPAVDPRLDNRTGDQRPPAKDEPIPQSVDGPEITTNQVPKAGN